jgi:hypothetical protein
MTQTATFPILESLPNVSTQAILYFSSTMGTLTEVDLVTSGSYSTEFHAENLGPSNTTIEGTTGANVAIKVPSGAIPVTIPSSTESFDASPFDGALDYGGTSGKDFAPVTSNSTPLTMILTSPADLAAFTGNFRIPVTVSGHATGSASSGNGDLSAGFKTQTSATITVIYHFIPNLPSLDPPSNTSPSSQPPSVPSSATKTVPGASSLLPTTSTQSHTATAVAKKKGHTVVGTSSHKGVHHSIAGHLRPSSRGDFRGIKSRSIHKT